MDCRCWVNALGFLLWNPQPPGQVSTAKRSIFQRVLYFQSGCEMQDFWSLWILSNSPTHEIGTKICSTTFSANKMLFDLAFVIKTLATRFTIQFRFYNMFFQMILVSSFCLSTMKFFFTFGARSYWLEMLCVWVKFLALKITYISWAIVS